MVRRRRDWCRSPCPRRSTACSTTVWAQRRADRVPRHAGAACRSGAATLQGVLVRRDRAERGSVRRACGRVGQGAGRGARAAARDALAAAVGEPLLPPPGGRGARRCAAGAAPARCAGRRCSARPGESERGGAGRARRRADVRGRRGRYVPGASPARGPPRSQPRAPLQRALLERLIEADGEAIDASLPGGGQRALADGDEVHCSNVRWSTREDTTGASPTTAPRDGGARAASSEQTSRGRGESSSALGGFRAVPAARRHRQRQDRGVPAGAARGASSAVCRRSCWCRRSR